MFILVFSAVYLSLNWYVYRGFADALGHDSWIAGTIIALLVLALYIAIFLEKSGRLRLSIPFSWIGYSWQGVGFIFASYQLLFDIIGLFATQDSPYPYFYAACGLTAITSIYGFVSARRPRARTIKLQAPQLDAPYRIVQITDLHLGDSSAARQVKHVVDTVNAHSPNLIVSTGDLFDGYLELLDPYIDLLKQLNATDGKYAVIGNHEVYAGLDHAIERTGEADFRLLRNQYVSIKQSLTLAGVDDPACGGNAEAEAQTLSQAPANAYTILLKHRPSIESQSLERINLQLSGHTHGGQIFPFIFLTKLAYKARHGLTQVGQRQYLYLSRGTGSWGPQIRVLAPPEITIIDLIP